MLVINNKNIGLVRDVCGIEMACRVVPDVTIDLDRKEILGLLETREISKETALASVHNAGVDLLGDIESLSLLERYASLQNPRYAHAWYTRRADWGKLLYSTPNNEEILERILRFLPQEDIERLDLSTARYLNAKVPALDIIVRSTVAEKGVIASPLLSVTDPTLTMWRALLTEPVMRALYAKTEWELFDIRSNNCIYVNTSEEETRLMYLTNTKPLPVLIARGKWTKQNIDVIYRRIEDDVDPESMMLILYERVCRLWGPKSALASSVKERLKYTKILTPQNLLKHYHVDWYPSVPAISYYFTQASEVELERIIDINYRAGSGIWDIVGVTTPSALRRICIASLKWMLKNRDTDTVTIRNILNVVSHYTYRIVWNSDEAKVCATALKHTYTKELKMQFILMSTFPHELKTDLV